MKNTDIKIYAKKNGVRLWQIADILNMADSNFSRMLRYELPIETKHKIFAIIDEIKAGE